jgi:hypothetical protein
MLWAKARGEAYRAEVVVRAAAAQFKPLKSLMGQNVKSPFSNIRAGTFKLHRCSSRIAGSPTKSP